MGALKGFFNFIFVPRLFFIGAVAALGVLLWKRDKIATNAAGYGVLGFLGVFFAVASFDPNFRPIGTKPADLPIARLFFALRCNDPNFRLLVAKPDNGPVVALIFLLVFFVWSSIREAVLNDRRI